MFITEASYHIQIELHHPFNYTGLDSLRSHQEVSVYMQMITGVFSAGIWCAFGFSAPRRQDGGVYCVYLMVGFLAPSCLRERERQWHESRFGDSLRFQQEIEKPPWTLPLVVVGREMARLWCKLAHVSGAKHQHWSLCLHFSSAGAPKYVQGRSILPSEAVKHFITPHPVRLCLHVCQLKHYLTELKE